ncbi:TPA: decaprenyl-phosphate phosphoribosyltransferase [Clostridium perfringens]|uniref:decaprenyl-phosphate phosphoribosyltransferase n=1 Tax=Clostridium perfringens TaxID=1502 RepID=UPI000D7122DF|nr:decaprenyl-phosphate phosphoribosyltransferase [Clostridium perfringens]EGT4137694.1 decaprenyl-phosphate phosphoribosyltransferase [Clostridium perfringens]EJT6172176.1 decaprenyl-phosphate phosphoribosyltransferase [Clostridium perfringens]EJT6342102.1 decaprenyl-phosphate phosphoribosyltransferase [Clostridium perfringens]EJT6542838.1 decaprenyl-phosphate phosphoribosyltransferase [Clostridium perfringens]EJT6567907.1 decaprenyl-phosphate phosphoribosyltransferase [Clostridium perfringen
MIKYIIKLLRPNQWIKNLFIFGPIIFSNKFLNIDILKNNILTFVAFCFISSTVYIMNDIVDVENDRKHPNKCKRPIASGKVSIPVAILIGIILCVTSLAIAFSLKISILFIIIVYLINNIFYSFKIKNLVIIDVFSIALGFIFRVLAGSFATGVLASDWIILCTLFLSLFLGFGKRRNEVIFLGENASTHRKNLSKYNLEFLDKVINISLTCTIVFYSIYCILGTSIRFFIFTDILVIWGTIRYYYLMYSSSEGESPTDLVLKDKQLIYLILIWGIFCIILLNLNNYNFYY